MTRRTIKLVCNGPNLPSSHTGPFTSGFFVQGLLVRRPLRFNRQQIVLALAIGRDGNEIANGRTPLPSRDSFSFSFLFFFTLYSTPSTHSSPSLVCFSKRSNRRRSIGSFRERGRKLSIFYKMEIASPLLSSLARYSDVRWDEGGSDRTDRIRFRCLVRREGVIPRRSNVIYFWGRGGRQPLVPRLLDRDGS